MNLEPCSLANLSSVQCEFAKGSLPASHHPVILIRLIGSAGNEAGESGSFDLASAMIMAGLEAWQPWAAILDLRRFGYQWGDEMENVLNAANRWYEPVYPIRGIFAGEHLPKRFPLAVVISDLNREGLTTLVKQRMQIERPSIFYESIDEAASALDLLLTDVPLV